MDFAKKSDAMIFTMLRRFVSKNLKWQRYKKEFANFFCIVSTQWRCPAALGGSRTLFVGADSRNRV